MQATVHQYSSYVIRFGPVDNGHGIRATLTSIADSGRSHHFDTLDGLFQFLQDSMQGDSMQEGLCEIEEGKRINSKCAQ